MQAIKTKFRKATATPRGRIIASVILLVFLAAIFGGIWYWNTHKKAIIRNELEKAIHKKSQGLYQIKYDDLLIDEIAGSLSVKNLHLTPDTIKYAALKKEGKAPPVLLTIHIPEINVSGVKTPRALIDNEIVGRKLELLNPDIEILYTNTGKDSSRNVPVKEIYEQILGNLDLIQIDTVLIRGAQITTKSSRIGKPTIQIQDVSIAMADVKVDSLSNEDTSRIFFAKEISLDCGQLSWSSANKLYNYRADSISLGSVSRDFRVKNFRMQPTLSEEAFVKAVPFQDDRFDFSVNNIRIRNIVLSELLKENIIADSMLIGSASFKIYRDLIIPRDKKNRVGSYPQQAIQDIPVTFRISKLIASNTFVEYKERNHISRQSGKVQFYNVYAAISNFTNNKKVIAENNLMTADISSSFLNQTPLKVSWVFYLRNPKGRFDLKGTVGPIDGARLNALTEPMGPASIKEGHINGASFSLQGHDYGMDGTVKFLYQDLKVALLEKDKSTKKMDEKALTSFVANLLIKNSNPKKNEDVRVAQVHLDRDTNHSIFYLTWKTLFKGIRECCGINK